MATNQNTAFRQNKKYRISFYFLSLTKPPLWLSGGGIFFAPPKPIVVIITDVMTTKKMICGYASAFGRPIDSGNVASTAAARPRGIITEVTFLVRSFFFVFVGLLASFAQIEYVIFGVIAAIAIFVGRIIITKTVLVKGFSKLDKKVTSVMIPRGLAAAVSVSYTHLTLPTICSV